MARVMKNSGIEWIGEIPAGWALRKGKWILSHLERPVEPDDGVITCFRDGEVTLRSKRREEGFTFSLQEAGYQGIEPGDLVVHGMDGFAGAIGISDSRGKGTPVLNVLDSTENKHYLMYFLRTMAYNGIFLALSTGIRVRSCDTNWNKLKELQFILPRGDEQEKIVDFLDRKCAEIDALIEKTKATIEEYKKLKQSVITEAVTKGIRGNRPMKDSGIEWIGEIPSHWSAYAIKYIMQESKARTMTGTETMLSVTQKAGIVKSEETSIANPSISTEDWRIVKEGDIVFNKYKAHSGVFFVSPLDGIVTFNYSVYKCISGHLAKYYEYLFKTPRCIGEFITYMRGVGDSISPLYTTELYKIKAIVPPLEEQEEIVAHLDKKCAALDTLIAKKTALLTELETYKKSLIYEYVTGKKELPYAEETY